MFYKIRKYLVNKLAGNDPFLLAHILTETSSPRTANMYIDLTPETNWTVTVNRQYPEKPNLTNNQGDE